MGWKDNKDETISEREGDSEQHRQRQPLRYVGIDERGGSRNAGGRGKTYMCSSDSTQGRTARVRDELTCVSWLSRAGMRSET